MAEVGYVSGFYFPRHHEVVDSEILKLEGDHHHKLLLSYFLNAKFNKNQRWIGKAGPGAEIIAGAFSDEQYSRSILEVLYRGYTH